MWLLLFRKIHREIHKQFLYTAAGTCAAKTRCLSQTFRVFLLKIKSNSVSVCVCTVPNFWFSIKCNHFHFQLSSSLPIVARSGWCTVLVDYELKHMRYSFDGFIYIIYTEINRGNHYSKKSRKDIEKNCIFSKACLNSRC